MRGQRWALPLLVLALTGTQGEGPFGSLARGTCRTYATVAGDSCTSLAYLSQRGGALFINRADGSLCTGDGSLLPVNETLRVCAKVLQGFIGTHQGKPPIAPPPLLRISKCFNQLVVEGVIDTGGGVYSESGIGALEQLGPQLHAWRHAVAGRQLILSVNNVKLGGASASMWFKNASRTLLAVAARYGMEGFNFKSNSDTSMESADALALLVTWLKRAMPWVWVSFAAWADAPHYIDAHRQVATALANQTGVVPVDMMGYTGYKYWDGYFPSLPADGFEWNATSYYVYTQSNTYVKHPIAGLCCWHGCGRDPGGGCSATGAGGGGGCKCQATCPNTGGNIYGVFIDSVEFEFNGTSCLPSTRRLGEGGAPSFVEDVLQGRGRPLVAGADPFCVYPAVPPPAAQTPSASCPGLSPTSLGTCCVTDWLMAKWGITGC